MPFSKRKTFADQLREETERALSAEQAEKAETRLQKQKEYAKWRRQQRCLARGLKQDLVRQAPEAAFRGKTACKVMYLQDDHLGRGGKLRGAAAILQRYCARKGLEAYVVGRGRDQILVATWKKNA